MSTPTPDRPVTVSVAVPGTVPSDGYSYRLPTAVSDLAPSALIGHAVQVPFGRRQVIGVVIGEGDPGLATRDVTEVVGQVATPEWVETLGHVARRFVSPLSWVMRRAYPTGIEDLATPSSLPQAASRRGRRYLSAAPALSLFEVAAEAVAEAQARDPHGQVLVLCPTRTHVTALLRRLDGAERLTKEQLAMWQSGDIAVGVATRVAATWEGRCVTEVVVLDPEHPGHVEASQPYTNARDISILRSRITGSGVTLVGRLPDPASLWGGVRFKAVGSRTAGWPKVVGFTRSAGGGIHSALPPQARAVIERHGGSVAFVAHDRYTSLICRRCSTRLPSPGTCPTCNGDEVFATGWSAETLAPIAERIGAEVVDAMEIPSGAYDVLVVVDPDSTHSRPGDPGLASTRLVLRAAEAVGSDGLVVCTRLISGGYTQRLVNDHDIKAVAQRAWRAAEDTGEPPHRREVWVSSARPISRPNIDGTRVHGPHRGADGYVLAVVCDDRHLDAVKAWVGRLRESGTRLRVKVR